MTAYSQIQEIHRKTALFYECSTTIYRIDFRSMVVDAIETTASSDAENPDRKQLSPSPQAPQHFSINDKQNTGKTRKVGFVLLMLS
jgi:hypothetical protein